LSFARRATVSLAAVALTAVGCGTVTQLSARQELSNAFGSLDDQSTLGLSISLDVPAERLVELAAAEGDGLSLDQAELLAGSSVAVTVASPDGQPLQSLAPDVTPSMGIAVVTPDGELAELRLVDRDLYARADVARIASLAGSPAPDASELGIDGVRGLEFVPDALAGRWLVADGDQLEAMGQQFAPSTTPSSEPDPSTLDKLRDKVGAAFDRSVTVTADGQDATLGQRYLLQASPRRLLGEIPGLLDGLGTAQGDLGPLLDPMTEDLSSVPDEPATLAVYVRDGVASAVRLDLGQFADDGSLDGVALLVRFTRSDDGVDAPAGATPVDVPALAQLLLFSGMAGGGDNPGA
jgi:hypothetical protein